MSIFPVFLAFAVAYAAAWITSKIVRAPAKAGRYGTIDGLRGYLAFSVVMHHSYIWWDYLHGGRWVAPQSAVYNNLGQGAVALFFMITGFLFSDKLLTAKGRDFDWVRLYVSRFMRLTPLYALAVLVFGVMVLVYSRGVQQPFVPLTVGFVRWFFFGFLGFPDLNGMTKTFRIVAGVFWTLPYEWLFYLLLPMLALVVRVSTPHWALALAAAATIVAVVADLAQPFIWLMFAGGILAAELLRRERWISVAKSHAATVVALASLIASFSLFHTSWGPVPLLLLSTFFCIVAAGNGLFGLLSSAASRTLGEMAYSMYLLHGIFLFTTFTFIVNPQHTLFQHWAAVWLLTPVLVACCFATYVLIERRGIELTPQVALRVRAVLARRSEQLS